MSKDRRLRIGLISPRELVGLLNWQGGSHVSVPLMPEKLPADVTVENVFYDWSRQDFAIVLHSESFPVVEDGDMLPLLETNGTLMFATARLRKGKDGKYGVAEENPLTPELTCGECKRFTQRHGAARTGPGETFYCDDVTRTDKTVQRDSTACVKIVQAESKAKP